jgi:hypothetical protein
MGLGEAISDVLLAILTIILILMNSIISDDSIEAQLNRIILSVLAISSFSLVMYSIGYSNAKYDLYYKIDNNVSIKNTIDFKKYKLKIQELSNNKNKD